MVNCKLTEKLIPGRRLIKLHMPQTYKKHTIALVEKAARLLRDKHGAQAALVALERLNRSIDRKNWSARDFWAQVVHAIHQKSG